MNCIEHYFENLLTMDSDIKGEPNKNALSKEVQEAIEICAYYIKYNQFQEQTTKNDIRYNRVKNELEPTTKNNLEVDKTDMIDKSNFSQEQYKADLQSAYDCGYEQAKNDLVVDCISRADVNQVIEDYMDEQYNVLSDRTRERAFGAKVVMARINELPSITPQEPRKDEVILTKEEYGELVSSEFDNGYAKGYREALEQEPRKGEWLRMSDLSEQEDDRYKCSRCGNVIHHKNKIDLYTFNSWCGRCGSDNSIHIHINYEVEE